MSSDSNPAHSGSRPLAAPLQEKLGGIRERIDTLDRQLQTLLNERATLAQEVAEIKLEAGETGDFYRPEREVQVLRKVKERQTGPLSKEEMARLFREVMSACLALEQPLTVAFLGPEGTFTQAATLKHFGHSVITQPQKSIDAIFREVAAGSVDYGVVPVENSTEGVINHTLDQLVNSSLKICGEVALRIHDHLMGAGTELSQVKRIYSHAQSLAQCRQWLNQHAHDIELIDVSSNAEAARRASREPDAAAIAGEIAAEIYGLNLIEKNIEDNPDNTTRFLILGRNAVPPSGDDKTVLLVSAQNRPGALFDLLKPLANHNVSMSRIESRPSQQTNWEYLFFVDIDGHCEDERIATAINELKHEASLFKILGSFPKAVM
jgi:chorismate mutase/prephenate dehydratase